MYVNYYVRGDFLKNYSWHLLILWGFNETKNPNPSGSRTGFVWLGMFNQFRCLDGVLE